MPYFQSERISPTLTRIKGVIGEWMYLVEGSENALLLDTGIGAGNLREYLQTLTAKPLTVVLTHGHTDHIGGATWFDTAWLHPNDHALAATQTSPATRQLYAARGFRADQPLEAFSPAALPQLLPLQDGQRFFLGGGVEVIMHHLPGHTAGCMAAYLPHERTMLLGDACAENNFFLGNGCITLPEYAAALEAFCNKHSGSYDTALSSHREGILPTGNTEVILSLCREVLAGQDDKAPFAYMGQPGLKAAKAVDERMKRLDGGFGNLMYK